MALRASFTEGRVARIASLQACIDLCLADTDINCISVNYSLLDTECMISKDSRYTQPDAYSGHRNWGHHVLLTADCGKITKYSP